MRGPIDYFVLGFDGNKFEGKILEQLEEVIKNDTISLIALSLIAKNDEGSVTSVEISDSGDEVISKISESYSFDDTLITAEDVEEIGEILNPNTAAALLVIEHKWAIGLKKAIKDAGGFLVMDGRIHPDAVAELEGGE